MEALQEYSGTLRKYLRRWLGIAGIQRQVRDLEGQMASVIPDIDRLNAATTRIGARFTSLLNQLDDALANDAAVADAARAEALQQASSELRPLVEQLESLGADASQPVPEPTPGQVPVEPGPDVPEVAPAADANAPAAEGAVPQVPGTGETAEVEPAPGESVPGPTFDPNAPAEEAPASEGAVPEVPGTQIPEGDVTPASEVPEAQGGADEVPPTNA